MTSICIDAEFLWNALLALGSLCGLFALGWCIYEWERYSEGTQRTHLLIPHLRTLEGGYCSIGRYEILDARWTLLGLQVKKCIRLLTMRGYTYRVEDFKTIEDARKAVVTAGLSNNTTSEAKKT